MSIYVVSDIHGHARAFDRALELAQPGSDDTVFVLGDMVDRGPDPLGVIGMVRALPNARVLMGNHEEMLYEALESDDEREKMTWHMNGGYSTYEQVDRLPRERYVDLMDWIAGLPTFAVVEVDDRRPSAARGDRRGYVLTHAGVDAPRLRASLDALGVPRSEAAGYAAATPDDLLAAMVEQDVSDLLWIRREFWSTPTGLVGTSGSGPVVVAGHTPSISMPRFASLMCGPGVDEDLRGVMVEVGCSRDTGGIADRVCVDCSAAVGHPGGRVGIMRLEDRRVWLADIEEGE